MQRSRRAEREEQEENRHSVTETIYLAFSG